MAALLASWVPGPSLLWDGQGYLGAARWIARDDWPLLGELDFYHPAYGALLAPSIWLGASPMGLFRWAQVVNVVAIAGAAVALGALARTLLPRGRTWLAATAAGVSYPALLLQAGFEWPEAPFAAAFALAALLAWRERHLGLAATVVALYALHPRGLGIVAVTLVLVVVRRRWGAVAVLAVGVAAVQLLNRLALDALYNPGIRSAAGAAVDTITDPGSWPDIALRAAGHSWYLLVATLGLAGVAVWSLARDRRPAALWLLGAVAAVVVASALQLTDRGRPDHLVYGRYVETLAPVLMVVAARALTPLRLLASLAAAAVLAAVTRLGNAAELFEPEPAWINVPVLAVWGELNLHDLTVVAVAGAAIVAVLALRHVASALAVVAVAGLATSVAVHAAELDEFAEHANETYLMGDDLTVADGVIAYDIAAYDKLASNRYQWQHPGLELPYWAHSEPPSPFILSSKAEPVDAARMVSAEPSRDLALWVAPGPEQDALAADGLLVLRNGEPVGDSFYVAEVERVDDDHVRITHAGGGAPWVPERVLPGDVGIVRLRAGSQSLQLPRVVHPGESVVVPVDPSTTTIELHHVHHRSFGRFDVSV